MKETTHPFTWLSPAAQWRLFLIALLLTLLVAAGLRSQGQSLITEAAPKGIVTFELIGTMEDSRQMIDSWGERGRIMAGLNLGLDYLFMLVYACALSLGCVLASGACRDCCGWLFHLGGPLAWGALLAGLLDAVENYALIELLLGSSNDLWPAVARWCALPKFGLVAIAFIYVAIGGLVAVVLKLRGAKRANR